MNTDQHLPLNLDTLYFTNLVACTYWLRSSLTGYAMQGRIYSTCLSAVYNLHSKVNGATHVLPCDKLLDAENDIVRRAQAHGQRLSRIG